jgi:Flp pilus assembly protein TadG
MRQRLQNESGSVIVIVALAMVVMLASVALSVDVGSLYMDRRGMVNAADAAALAAALSYARNEATCGTNDGPAKTKANSLATANASTATPDNRSGHTPYAVNCGAGKVTVQYYRVHNYFFGPIIGHSTGNVASRATAVWGSTGSASKVAPLMLAKGGLSSCNIPNGVTIGQSCYFWWDANGSTNMGHSQWGIMDLNSWGPPYLTSTASCSGFHTSQSEFTNWVRNGYPRTLTLKVPAPTYVCDSSGSQGNALDNDINSQAGKLLIFPVNDQSQQVDKNGAVCLPTNNACNVDKYAIVGFAELQVGQVWKGQQALSNCGQPPFSYQSQGSLRCLSSVWKGYHETGSIGGGGGQNFGLITVGLGG